MSDSGARWPHWPNLLKWNRHYWFWRYRDGPSPGWDPFRHRPTWMYPHPFFRPAPHPGWSGYETWWVLDEANRRWVRPTYWGGLGCSCDDGHCCRTCRRGRGLDGMLPKCAVCGNTDICKLALCAHPCCRHANEFRVVERLEIIVPTLHRKLTVALGDELLRRIADYLRDEPFVYGRIVSERP